MAASSKKGVVGNTGRNIPTTPNPTGGYMLLLPKSRVQELDMSVDQALKYIISMGVAAPPPRANGELARWAASNQSALAAPPPDQGNTNA